MSTISRTTALPNPASDTITETAGTKTTITRAEGKSGIAIHLDAPQRLAYSNALGQICAEPSPDAMQAYAASLGASFSAPSKESAAIAAAFSGSASGIGLRTQAITLMRDSLYRICEAHYNKAINDRDVVQLLQRSQDVTLGVLAIEQLTGAVVARQPILTPASNASSTANLNRNVAALDQAKKSEADKKAAIDAQTEALNKLKESVPKKAAEAKAAQDKVAPAQVEIAKLKPQVAAEDAKLKTADAGVVAATEKHEKQKAKVDDIKKALEAATIKKDQAEIEKQTKLLTPEQGQLDTDFAKLTKAKTDQAAQKAVLDPLQASLKKAEDDVANAAKAVTASKAEEDALAKAEVSLKNMAVDYKDAQVVTEIRRAELNSSVTAAQAATNGGGSFAPATDRDNINKETVSQIAEATKSIVETVVNKGHLTEMCQNILSSTAILANSGTNLRLDNLMKQCDKIIEANINAIIEYQKSYAEYLKAYRQSIQPTAASDGVPLATSTPTTPAIPATSASASSATPLPTPPVKNRPLSGPPDRPLPTQ